MRKAGGIIAIIAGVFAILAAGATLLVGGIGSAVDAKDASTVVALGWGGVLFAFLVNVFGALALGADSRMPGILLVLCSIAGAILGGTLVAIFMVLSLIGGVLAAMAGKPRSSTAT